VTPYTTRYRNRIKGLEAFLVEVDVEVQHPVKLT
jgi:hypothetical protein